MEGRGSDAAGSGPDPRRRFDPDEGPWVLATGWSDHARYRSASDEHRDLARRYHDDGYVVVEQVAPAELVAAARAALEPWVDVARPDPRLTNAWWALGPVRRLACLPAVIDLLEFLHDRRAVPFQTLDFPVGTEQAPHRDEVHFDTLPAGFVAGVWIALEDVGVDQGPLVVHPGSHRCEGDDAAARGPVTVTVRAGDAVVWSSRLVHGGAPVRRPESTRWSQVTHYVFEGTVPYTPVHSAVEAGELALRRPLLDLRTWRPVRATVRGERARFVHGPRRRSRLRFPGDPVPPVADRLRSLWFGTPPLAVGVLRPWASRLSRRPPRG